MKTILVTGQTDASVYYKDICVMTWEDKNLKEKIDSSSNLGQQYVEVKANAEKFLDFGNRQPPSFYGILTSGKNWIFLNHMV